MSPSAAHRPTFNGEEPKTRITVIDGHDQPEEVRELAAAG
jgi:hypothetical protein